MDVHVWHDDSTNQGLLTLEGDESPLVAGMEIPQPINVGEEVFDSLYRIIADARLGRHISWMPMLTQLGT